METFASKSDAVGLERDNCIALNQAEGEKATALIMLCLFHKYMFKGRNMNTLEQRLESLVLTLKKS